MVGGAYANYLFYSYLTPSATAWTEPVVIPSFANSSTGQLYSGQRNGGGMHQRSTPPPNDSIDDYFKSNSFPHVAINPVNGRIYLVYRDLPSPGDTQTDQGDIYVIEGIPSGSGLLTWGSTRRVNNDGTPTDQWHPSAAVSPSGHKLFIGYYSRQVNPGANNMVRMYAATADVASGLAAATFDVFPISNSSFPVLFPGSTTSTPPSSWWLFDHLWIQSQVCLGSTAQRVVCSGAYEHSTEGIYRNFCGDDYTWAGADSRYFYFAWCDRSLTSIHNGMGRPDPNVRIAKIKF